MNTIALTADWQAVMYTDEETGIPVLLLQHVSCVIHEDTGQVLDLTKVETADPAQVHLLSQHENRLMTRTIELHADGSAWIDPGGALSRAGVLGEDAFMLVEPTLQGANHHMKNKPLKQGA